MERQLWPRLYRAVMAVANGSRPCRAQFGDAAVVLTQVWAVLHDRPTCWACDADNWDAADEDQRPFLDAPPSPSTMSRRLRSLGVRQLLGCVQQAVADWFPRAMCCWMDSKALPVGGASGDPDALIGRGAGVRAKGYRLHILYNAGGAIIAWLLAPMNTNDAVPARDLLRTASAAALWGYVAADGQYDGNALYDLAEAANTQLIAEPRRGDDCKGLGHQRHSPHRLRGLALRKKPFGRDLLHARGGIERYFATAGNFGGGMGPLPNWVRRPRRVSIWIAIKLLIDAVRRAIKQRVAA
jgi:hypothetical protein